MAVLVLLHIAMPQLVPGLAFWQAPLPSQVPLKPQVVLPVHRPFGSTAPAITGWHVPGLPARLQTRQVPQLEVEQQTPSTQLPLSHSLGSPQAWPSRLSPHLPVVVSQTLPGAQSIPLVQTETQAVPAALQANGTHDWVVAALQVPLPSQVRGCDAVVPVVGQAAGTHWVPPV
jgi:hypothetical protein